MHTAYYKKFNCINENQIIQVVNLFTQTWQGKSSIFLLEGEMGSGKTTFIRYMLDHLKIDYFLGSPTFQSIQEYDLLNSYGSFRKIFHLDLDRVVDMESFETLAIHEILYNKNHLIFVENHKGFLESLLNIVPYWLIQLTDSVCQEDQRTYKVELKNL